jgi:hypothetical protein
MIKRPENVAWNSDEIVGWTCTKCFHRWEDSIKNRTKKGKGCPKCKKNKKI